MNDAAFLCPRERRLNTEERAAATEAHPAHRQHTGLSLGHELLPARASLCVILIEKKVFAKQNYAVNKKAGNLFPYTSEQLFVGAPETHGTQSKGSFVRQSAVPALGDCNSRLYRLPHQDPNNWYWQKFPFRKVGLFQKTVQE